MERLIIASIGECMVELQETQPGVIQQTFGGDTLNTAIYMARLGQNLPVQVDYVTALGTDKFSSDMIAFWEKEQVGSSMVQRLEEGRPGLYYIQLDDKGERFFHYWRGEAAARKCFEWPGSEKILDSIENYNAIYLSGISLAILLPTSRNRLLDRLADLCNRGTAIYFDCNYRPHLWQSPQESQDIYSRIFSIANTVFLNVEEGVTLLGQHNTADVHTALGGYGVQESVIRDGGKPCSIFRDGQIEKIGALPITKVVDTTAAGDSFSATYIIARRLGRTVLQAAELAHQMAAYVIGHKGAIAPSHLMPFSGETLAGK